MQDIFKQVFEAALREKGSSLQKFQHEDAIFYKGFKASVSKGIYKWEDTRYDNYYEPVDPKITDKVLSKGFVTTINEVMNHTDKERVLEINREVERIDAKINFWTKESTRIWAEYNRESKKERGNEKKLKLLERNYNKDKNLFQKKRRVLVEEKEEVRRDLNFYKTRIKMYNN